MFFLWKFLIRVTHIFFVILLLKLFQYCKNHLAIYIRKKGGVLPLASYASAGHGVRLQDTGHAHWR